MAEALAVCGLVRDTTTIIALGDAPNDAEMLAAADIAVIIPNPGGKSVIIPDNDAKPDIRRAQAPAPHGWNTEILYILNEFKSAGRLDAVAEDRG